MAESLNGKPYHAHGGMVLQPLLLNHAPVGMVWLTFKLLDCVNVCLYVV
jgi:hypothetical protein